jgi:branched-subunit amino acid transport protein
LRSEVLALALIVGACTWALRYIPLRWDISKMPEGGALARFLAATGPAAIGTLFVAEVMPYLANPLADQFPLIAGVLVVIAVYAAAKSAVLATLAGSLAFGLVTAWTG